MLTEQQIAQRATMVGCSDLYRLLPAERDDGAIVYPHRYQVWAEKVVGVRRFTGDEDFIRWGNELEAAIAADWAHRQKQAGFPVRLYETRNEAGPVTLVDPARPWFGGTPDRLPVRAWHKGPAYIPDVETIWRLRDAGALTRGLECKSGAEVAIIQGADEDRWGDGAAPHFELLADLLAPHCHDGVWLARAILDRFTLGLPIGEAEQGGEDVWGEEGTAQLPRPYICQCIGYMALTGLREWPLHALLARFGRFEARTYLPPWDEDLAGMLLENAERFVVDYLLPKKPPPQDSPDAVKAEVLRRWPRPNGDMLPLTPERADLLDRHRAAVQASKRADVALSLVEAEVIQAIGNSDGIDGGKGFRVTYGAREGRRTVDAMAVADAMGEALRAAGVHGGVADRIVAEALEQATRIGKGWRQLGRPQSWTKGIEAEVLAAMKGGER